MAKTLVGLYSTITDAQHVAHDLVAHDFSRNDIQVAVARREARHDEDPYIGDWIVADEGLDLVDQLVDVGVPLGEASSYAEGIRRGGALVVVDSSDEDADRGLVVMNRLQPMDSDTDEHLRTGQTPIRHAAADIRTGVTPATTMDFSTYEADYRRHHNATLLSYGAYADYEPAYRYGYALGTNARYRGWDWAALEADAHREWEARHPSTWERFKDAIRYAWDKVTGDLTDYEDSYVDRLQTTRVTTTPDFSTYDPDYRQHHSTTFLTRGAYEDYVPAYRYGYDLGMDERYRGRMWEGLEEDFRRGWETQRPGTWERFKDAIRYGWNTVRERI